MPFYVNTQKPDSSREIARLLEKCIKRHKRDWTEIVFLCIGSDRVRLSGTLCRLSFKPASASWNFCLRYIKSTGSRRQSIRYNGLYFKEPSVCPCNCYRRVSRR